MKTTETQSNVVGSEASTGRQREQRTDGRRSYMKPHLIDHGRLAAVALGGSPGVGDSSGSFTQMPP